MIPLGEGYVRQILKEWGAHYNASRPHMSLGPGIPDETVPKPERQVPRHSIPKHLRVVASPVLDGLHHEYRLVRIAA
jgi:putative transposase